MPKISQKRRYINDLCQIASTELIWSTNSNTRYGWQEFDDIVDEILLTEAIRYIVPRNPVPKSDQWYRNVLPDYNDDLFRKFLRVSRLNFGRILLMIQDHHVFRSNSSKKQTPVDKQLAITLYKLGNDGSSNSIHNVAAVFGIGGGGSVMLIIERVLKAILSLEHDYIRWPDENERANIELFMGDKLPKCIGYIDGSHIPLDEAPLDDPESYFTRKQRYAIHLQAVCDNDRIIRNIFIGYPGSVHDARVYSNSEIGIRPESFLTNGQWIAGDSPYAVSDFMITPFRNNATAGTASQRRAFNKYFSKYRVNIECVFGIMKETFGSLKGLGIRVDKQRGHKLACDWIMACCILYNIIKPTLPAIILEDLGEEDHEMPEATRGNDRKRIGLFNFITGKLALQ